MSFNLPDDDDDILGGMKAPSRGFNFWKPKVGTNRVRIIPAHEDAVDSTGKSTTRWYEWIALHSNLPGVGRPIYCPQKMDDKPCAACAIAAEHYRRNDKDGARPYASTWRALINLVEMDEDGELAEDAEIKTWAAPRELIETNLRGVIAKLKTADRNIVHPLTGRDVFIDRTGTSAKKTRYAVSLAEQTEWSEDLMALVDEGFTLLSDVYPPIESSKIVGLLEAGESDDEPNDPFEDEDEDEKPRRRRIPAPKEEVIDGEYEEVEEEEEEEKPVRKPAKASPPKPAVKTAKPAEGGSQREKLLARLRKEVPAGTEEDEEDDD